MPADAEAIVREVLRDALAPEERLTVDVWADTYRRMLPPSPMPGPWKTDRVPYLREPMRMYTEPGVRRIVLKFGTQCSKTEMMLNCALYTVACDPFPILWVTDNADNARDFMRDRFIPAARACAPVAALLPSNPHEVTSSHVLFSTCTMHATGSNSPGNLASKPVGRPIFDEINKYPEQMKGGKEGRALEVGRSRTHAYGDLAVELDSSSPTLEDVGIDREYARSDQRKYHVPCPACGEGQTLGLGTTGRGGIRWEGGVGSELGDVELEALVARVRRTAWYECAKCGARIEQGMKGWMLARGVWVADGQRSAPDPDGALGDLVVLGEAPETDTRGYWISQLYSPFRSWGDVAAEFVQLRGKVTQEFVNQVLAEAWVENEARTDENTLLGIVERSALLVDEAGVYRKGERPGPHAVAVVPPHEIVPGRVCDAYPAASLLEVAPSGLTGYIDVQRDEVYYEVSAWGPGERRWVIDWGRVACPSVERLDGAVALGQRVGTPRMSRADAERFSGVVGEAWAGVASLVSDRVYPDLATGEAVGVGMWGIDSGDRTAEVYHFAARMRGRVVATKGRSGVYLGSLYEEKPADRAMEYGIDEPISLLHINVKMAKDLCFARLHQVSRGLGAIGWPDPATCAGDLNGFLRQLSAEHLVTKKARQEWQLRPGRRDNHWGDCHVGNYALAVRYGLREMDSEELAGRGAPVGAVLRTSGLTEGALRAD